MVSFERARREIFLLCTLVQRIRRTEEQRAFSVDDRYESPVPGRLSRVSLFWGRVAKRGSAQEDEVAEAVFIGISSANLDLVDVEERVV